jgi:hypothetical protein
MNTSTDHNLPSDSDARIDELARATGRELRRPAPAYGMSQVHRARRTRQVARGAMGGTAALVVVALGVLGVQHRNRTAAPASDVTVAITEPQDTTSVSTAVSIPSPVVQSTPPESKAPDVNASAPPGGPSAAGPSPVVYTQGGGDLATETLLDAATGTVLGTQPVDFEKSAEAWNADAEAHRAWDFVTAVGDITYTVDPAHDEDGTFLVPESGTDACGQVQPEVTGATGSALPKWAFNLGVSRDRRFVVVESATCPEAGQFQQSDFDSAGPREIFTDLAFSTTIEVFDAAHPELEGRILATDGQVTPGEPKYPIFSENGRFVSLGFDAIFDLETGERIDVAQGCPVSSSRSFERMVGESSIVFISQCASGDEFVIRDLMPGGAEVRHPVQATGDGTYVDYFVARTGFTTPTDAWFIACSHTWNGAGTTSTDVCKLGHGSESFVELPGVSNAAFFPLGWTPGG